MHGSNHEIHEIFGESCVERERGGSETEFCTFKVHICIYIYIDIQGEIRVDNRIYKPKVWGTCLGWGYKFGRH